MIPVPPPVADPARLLADLVAARLVSAVRGARLLAEYRQQGGHGNFLDHLLASGLLTEYQAERITAGQAQTLLLGPYLLQEPVGSGSLGTVYKAVHRGDRRRVAVKVLPLRSLWNVLQAKKQVSVLGGLPPHPTIVPLADVDTAGQSHFLAWPFVEGETFEGLVRRSGPLPPAHAARLLAEVVDGLAVLHAHGIAHGLLKPSNLLLGADGHPRLLDVGMGAILAENLAAGESMLDTISTANAAISSFDYAAPETILDPTVRTPAADVYSLGCVFHCLLTGSPPFPDGNAVDKMLAHTSEPPPPVRDRNPLVPEALAELTERLMQKNPADRPADLPAVRLALLAAADDKPGSNTTRPPAPRPEPAAEVGSDTPTDPPRATPPVKDTFPELSDENDPPLSVALSMLRSKLAAADAKADGTPESVDFDLPDPDAPKSDLPGLIDTGPPGLFALPPESRPVTPAPPPSAVVRRPAPSTVTREAPPLPAPPASTPRRPAAVQPTPVNRPLPPPAPAPFVATPAPAAPVAWHKPSQPPAPSSRRVYAPAPPPPPPPAFADRAAAAAGGLLAGLGRLANRVLPGIGPSPAVEVQVSVFGPRHLEPGKTVRLQVYAHPVDAFASVCTLSRALQPDSEVLAVGQLSRKVKRGEQVGLHLSVKNGGLARNLTSFEWLGKPKAEPFELLVPWESPAGRTPAALTVGLNNVQAGRVQFELSVLPRSG